MNGDDHLVRRTSHVLRPDPSRVITTELIPSAEGSPEAPSRLEVLLQRVLDLPDDDVRSTLDATLASFGPRHHDLAAVLDERFDHVAHHVPGPNTVSLERRRLVGAYMSQEYAVEAAALLNPSMIRHPDQAGLPRGATRFLMSARGVGEGHISCIEFRTGTVGANDEIHFDTPPPQTTRPVRVTPDHSRLALERLNEELPGPSGGATAVLASLPPTFNGADLHEAVGRWLPHAPTTDAAETASRLAGMAQLDYALEFPGESRVDSRVIMPGSPVESRGMEDLRLTCLTAADGHSTYVGTYTAYDGTNVAPHLLSTEDFVSFRLRPLTGPAAKNKGLALFPRPVGGRYLALSRWDRESNSLATSPDLLHWEDAGMLPDDRQPSQIVRSGNGGSPLETDAGWLVLTHGVGPMREYTIGALLLDLEDPLRVIGALARPLLSPSGGERDGYVPNVVYSCGSMLHGDTVVLPYGASDTTVRVALVDLPRLLEELTRA